VSLLRDRRLVALLAAEVISSTGTQMTLVALPWFVLRTTGSPQRMSWVLVAEAVPIVVTGLWGGAAAARLGARRTMLLADFLRAPLFAAIPALSAAGLLGFPLLLALAAASGFFLVPYGTVQVTVVPDLVGERHVEVARVTALFQAANRVTFFVGPTIAGLLIAAVGAERVLYLDAATYLLSFALVGLFVHVPSRPVALSHHEGVRGALRFIGSDRLLRAWAPAITALGACQSLFFICLPVLVVARYAADPHVLGFLFGGFGVGSLAGALLALRVADRLDPLVTTATCLVAEVLVLWVLVGSVSWPVAVASLAASGLFTSLVNAPMYAFLILRIPPQLRTQTYAVLGVCNEVATPLALFAGGWALAHYEAHVVIAALLALELAAVTLIAATALRERAGIARTAEG
jgi:predicted MFS family arabinose efflux permease